MHVLRATWRAVQVTAHVLLGALISLATAPLRLLRVPHGWFPHVVSWWHRRLCRLLGMRSDVRGRLEPTALLVANHVSWLDIPVLGACGPITFLSKAEVADWPLIGWLASVAGTLYIERGAHQASHLSASIGHSIHLGRSVVIFPEGTTGTGHDLGRFHPRLFAAAQQPGLRVQPVAIRYGTSAQLDPVAPFIGDDSLVPHLWRVLRHPGLRVEVSFLPALETTGLDRRRLAEQARGAIAGALGLAPSDAAVKADGAGRSRTRAASR